MKTPSPGVLPTLVQIGHRQSRQHFARGFTLVEVMIGLLVFLLTSLGILSGLFQARKLAEKNLRNETVLIYAQSYLEDIKGVPYANLVDAATSSSKSLSTRVALKNNTATTLPLIDFRGTTLTTDDMTMVLTPSIVKVPDLPADKRVAAYVISLKYSWRVGPSGSPIYSGEGILRSIRSDMSPLVISAAYLPPT